MVIAIKQIQVVVLAFVYLEYKQICILIRIDARGIVYPVLEQRGPKPHPVRGTSPYPPIDHIREFLPPPLSPVVRLVCRRCTVLNE